jgi:hypothetical protein
MVSAPPCIFMNMTHIIIIILLLLLGLKLYNNATKEAGSPETNFAAPRQLWTSNFMQQTFGVI